MPCLNEQETISECIHKAKEWIDKTNADAEILIADNGSTDNSVNIAIQSGARVTHVKPAGYGNALYYGCIAAHGDYIIMGDSDCSYDFSKLDLFAEKLEQGHDLVMGNRFKGGIAPNAMPWKNRYIGNPFLSWIGKVLFDTPCGDFHCGIRGINKSSFKSMDLRTSGMEFASEMVIKAKLFGMKICEVPTTLSKDKRNRPPHLRPWRDGWRHLRFMLIFSPRWLFLAPGAFLMFTSLLIYIALLATPIQIKSIVFDVHSLFYAQAGIIVGFSALISGFITRIFGAKEGLLKEHIVLKRLNSLPILEIGAALSILLMAAGVYLAIRTVVIWNQFHFGPIENGKLLRMVSISTTLLTLGGISFFTSLIAGFLMLPTRNNTPN